MSFLVFDTETTGKTLKNEPSPLAIGQPRIVSVAAVLFDNDGKEVSTFYSLIKPTGFVIPEEVTAIHGITTKAALEFGLDFNQVYPMIVDLNDRADRAYAFNLAFDSFLFDIETAIRYGRHSCFTEYKERTHCLMLHMAQMMKLPGRYGDYAWPKLAAAYEWYFKQPMPPGAHNALNDTRYTGWLAAALHQNGQQPK